MLTATIQSLYILSLGASLSAIAYLQIIHSVAYLLAAICSAAVVRAIGGKAAYIFATLLVFLYFAILFQGEFNRSFYVGQVSYAVGLAVIETASSDWIFGRAVDESLVFREVMHDFRAMLFVQNFIFMTAGSLSVFLLGYSSAYSLTLLSLVVGKR